jgi:hypothetical protein
MNKKGLIIGTLILGLISLIPLAYALSPSDFTNGFNQVIEYMKAMIFPFFSALFGVDTVDQFFFAKILLLLLLFIIIAAALKNVPTIGEKSGIRFIVSAIVATLAIRYIKENEFINGILLPYGALGASIIVFLPLLVYFFFVEGNVPGKFGRRAAWALYGIFFIALFVSRFSGLDSIVQWVYYAGIGFVLLCFIFDGPIHEYFGTRSYTAHRKTWATLEKVKVIKALQDLEAGRASLDPGEYQRAKSALEKKKRQLDKY